MPNRKPASTAEAASRYRRIAPAYDLFDLPFEYLRYRPLRRMLFAGLSGHILDAGVGTGRNMPFYPAGAAVTGIDASPAMLARAESRRARLGVEVTLLERDIADTRLPGESFDAVVASFLFCVLAEEHHHVALSEIARLCKPGGEVRLLEYTRPNKPLRRALTGLWEPWVRWAYGASFDRNPEPAMAEAGLTVVEARFVVDELVRYIRARPKGQGPKGQGPKGQGRS
jgi:ubiquinone/menaquinone biosynthesis C-methylase UbiE